ncbi:RNA-binding protein Mug28 [Schizosaccharomyces cryophilus OY26]|uniref:RNA-binding protein Mug28 n=1 Tax=Schizosaccharomyces cryophilus (strain OY26 / ATCC MYA-4695 / CBS 11777 / NBRC 106824 / NRRL Y48691) TaxID=653667 RepID=S9WY99_SCHCR|nr:RNA-binding protein Mug28 [Schizosaccharomyces cryophilus OY26]EPY49707.1 RNA-binding protein Mug28 [Schizosaccharomyces cryophilus OY26]
MKEEKRVQGINKRQKNRDLSVYIGNLPYGCQVLNVVNLCQQYGNVIEAHVLNRRKKKSINIKGSALFAFVYLETPACVEAIVQALHGFEYEGNRLIVEKRHPAKSAIFKFTQTQEKDEPSSAKLDFKYKEALCLKEMQMKQSDAELEKHMKYDNYQNQGSEQEIIKTDENGLNYPRLDREVRKPQIGRASSEEDYLRSLKKSPLSIPNLLTQENSSAVQDEIKTKQADPEHTFLNNYQFLPSIPLDKLFYSETAENPILVIGILNIPMKTSPVDLYDDFSQYGKILGAAINQTPNPDQTLYAELAVNSHQDCSKIIAAFQNFLYKGIQLQFFVKQPMQMQAPPSSPMSSTQPPIVPIPLLPFEPVATMEPPVAMIPPPPSFVPPRVPMPSAINTIDMNTPQASDPCNLFVKNIDDNVVGTSEQFEEFFSQFGRVKSCVLASYPNTGISKGYGFVSFNHPSEAMQAISFLNNTYVGKKRLFVSFAEKKEERKKRLNALFNQELAPAPPAPVAVQLSPEPIPFDMYSQYMVVPTLPSAPMAKPPVLMAEMEQPKPFHTDENEYIVKSGMKPSKRSSKRSNALSTLTNMVN